MPDAGSEATAMVAITDSSADKGDANACCAAVPNKVGVSAVVKVAAARDEVVAPDLGDDGHYDPFINPSRLTWPALIAE